MKLVVEANVLGFIFQQMFFSSDKQPTIGAISDPLRAPAAPLLPLWYKNFPDLKRRKTFRAKWSARFHWSLSENGGGMELESGAKSRGKMMHFEPLQMLYTKYFYRPLLSKRNISM